MFPKLDMPGLSEEQKRLVIMAFNAKCLHVLLQPLKAASAGGVLLACYDEVQRLVFPRLLSYVADEPEISMVTCHKSHHSKHPCDVCMVRKAWWGTCQQCAAGATTMLCDE
jgi:hypothetical protein